MKKRTFNDRLGGFTKTWEYAKQPFRCPVCGGKGIVPHGFYMTADMTNSAIATNPETCRTCSGQGIVWEPTDETERP